MTWQDSAAEWRSIIGWDGRYEVSDLGEVRECKSQRILGQWSNPRGYKFVRLARPRAAVMVHRLVAMAFLPNPERKPAVNHLDCSTGNNCVSNLEWCTQAENIAYAARLGRMSRHAPGKRPPHAALTTDQVCWMRRLHSAGDWSFAALGREFGVSKRTVGRVLDRETYANV